MGRTVNGALYDNESTWKHQATTTSNPSMLGIQMEGQEYPVKVEISIIFPTVGFYNYYDRYDGAGIYLADQNGQNLVYLGYVDRTGKGAINGTTGKHTWEISDADGKTLKGKSLSLVKYNGGGGIFFNAPYGPMTVTVTTKVDACNVTVSQTTGGTVSASSSLASPGTEITLTATPSTGYYLDSWGQNPSSLAITNGKFSMPEQDVTITPVWKKTNYTITKAVIPAGAGGITAPATGQYGDSVSFSQRANTGYRFTGWNVTTGWNNGSFTMPAQNVTITAYYEKIPYAITRTVEPEGAGTITAPATAGYGDEVSVSQTPSTGYTFSHWELSTGIVAGGKFTMPAEAVTLKAVYTRNVYRITAETEPTGAGVITCAGTAGYADTIAVSQSPNPGYYFDGWTLSSGGTVENGSFTMPDGDVTVTARYLQRSTATLSTNNLKGGENVAVTIATEDKNYTHTYQITFSGAGIDTGETAIAGEQMRVEIPVPESWASEETGAPTITGGVFTLRTYRDGVLIGTHETGGLVYVMPDDAAPRITGKTVTRLMTAEGQTFADLGLYVQNHSGVRVDAQAAGQYGASIASVRIRILGYEGTKYDRTYQGSSASFQSGILTRAGDMIIQITATDGRGLQTTETLEARTVEAYVNPEITLFEVWRTDSAGDEDDTGQYGKYRAAYQWTQVGSNSVQRSVTAYGTEQTVTTDEDWILPGNRQIFPGTQTAMITYRVWDQLESTEVSVRLDTRRFIMHVNAAGTSAAFGHAVQETPTAGMGYTGTFEIDDSMEVWIGHMTLKQYIQGVVNGTI